MTDTDTNVASAVENTETAAQTQYSAPFAVNISFPEPIIIKMVDASALDDYEFGLFISSSFFSAFIGFLVAWFQTAPEQIAEAKILGIMTLILVVCAVSFFGWALKKRSKMRARAKEFTLKTSGVQEVKGV